MERTQSGLRVTYYYSACVGIASPDVTILCDPWFTDGIYDGAWYQYPRLERPLDTIGPCGLIWISHIHPDHYDARFLHEYLERFPGTRIVIGTFEPSFLSQKMRADGIPHDVVEELNIGETRIRVFLNTPGPPSAIDSALAVRWRDHAVVNMNDNAPRQGQLEAIRSFCGSIDIGLLPYTGAGPYPQTYASDEAQLLRQAAEKKEAMLDQYRALADALNPRLRIPFAGKYVLGGRLADLNPYLGLADAVEVTRFDRRAAVLADGGHASVDTETLTPSAARTEPYDAEEVARFLRSIADRPMDYESWFSGLPEEALPLHRLLPKAYRNARRWSLCDFDWHLCLQLPDGWFACNVNGEGEEEFAFRDSVEKLYPRSELRVDPRYLFGLITCVFHWNNAEVGSQFETRRHPDEFRREVNGFLNFLHV